MPPTPARPRPKYLRDLIILILKKGPANAADPGPVNDEIQYRFNNILY